MNIEYFNDAIYWTDIKLNFNIKAPITKAADILKYFLLLIFWENKAWHYMWYISNSQRKLIAHFFSVLYVPHWTINA